MFPELLAEGLEPWGGVTQVWAAGSPDARHGVDITATFAQGVASLRAHEAYLRGRFQLAKRTPEGFAKAIENFNYVISAVLTPLFLVAGTFFPLT